MISPNEQKKLSESKVVILGVGGLGGYVVEMLTRIGVGNLILVDFDKFEPTNLNRQIISKEDNLGLSKVEEAEKRVKAINSVTEVIAVNKRISVNNICKMFFIFLKPSSADKNLIEPCYLCFCKRKPNQPSRFIHMLIVSYGYEG